MLDVELMMEMGHSPPSWKVWQPKFIEWIKLHVFDVFRGINPYSGEPTFYELDYDKKASQWICEEIKDVQPMPK